MPALLVDMGGVLCLTDRETPIRELQEYSRHPVRQAAPPLTVYREYMDSGLNDQFDGGMPVVKFYREMCRFFDIDPANLSYREFRRIWGLCIKDLNQPLITLLREIRERACPLMAFASNTQELHWEYFVRHHGQALDLFDAFVLSHAVDALKPDPQFWVECSLRLGVEIPAMVLLDDKPANGASLVRAGGQFIHYVAERHVEVERRLRKLYKLD